MLVAAQRITRTSVGCSSLGVLQCYSDFQGIPEASDSIAQVGLKSELVLFEELPASGIAHEPLDLREKGSCRSLG